MLIIISNCICKRNLVREAFYFKIQQSRVLLDVFQSLDYLFKMPTYNNYMNFDVPFYEVSPLESSRYTEYVH